jgi:hypothetical protein
MGQQRLSQAGHQGLIGKTLQARQTRREATVDEHQTMMRTGQQGQPIGGYRHIAGPLKINLTQGGDIGKTPGFLMAGR